MDDTPDSLGELTAVDEAVAPFYSERNQTFEAAAVALLAEMISVCQTRGVDFHSLLTQAKRMTVVVLIAFAII